jgi:aminopeptidase-like protein
MIGKKAHTLAKRLWPLNRSLTGEGVRDTLKIIKEKLPELQIKEVPSGTEVFDWRVPKEWYVSEAWIKCPDGKVICDFNSNNLHLVGYSHPIHKHIDKSELLNNLHSIPDMPDAIPYVTSYYTENWGFCISENEKKKLSEGVYEVYIKSKLFDGVLNYGELLIKGELEEEIFLSTYICHPSMANDQLSGICVTTFLADWIENNKNRKYSYRIVFIPETIGSITYLSRNIDIMKSKIIAGFNITCVGDEKNYSYLPSRKGDTLSDKIAKHILKHIDNKFIIYKWSDRGSDERQYCAPNIDLPVVSIMRSKYGSYKEYHSSLDNLTNVVTAKGLEGGYKINRLAIEAVENNFYPKSEVYGEPQMGKRELFPEIKKLAYKDTSSKQGRRNFKNLKDESLYYHLLMNIISWSDGKHSLLDIAEICEVPIWELYPMIEILKNKKIIQLHSRAI